MATTGTSTIRDTVTDALLEIEVGTIGQTVEAADLALGLRHLNRMLKAWQGQGDAQFLYARQTLTLTTAASYTLSPVRPVRIISANMKRSGIETPMIELNRQKYDALPQKSTTGLPTQYYYDRQKEAALFYVWPVLATAAGETVEITYEREFEDVTDASDTIDLPAEWYDAVIYGLAARLCGSYGIPDQRRMVMAQEADRAKRMAMANDVEESVYWNNRHA